jgi:hypothetical protein
MTSKRYQAIVIAAVGVMVAIMAGLVTYTATASGTTNEGVCAGTHLYPPNDSTESLVITAPEGKLISGYCVKAGSIHQGNGPEYVTVNPPAKTVTISHSSGKDISHYTVTYVDDTTPTTVPEVTTTVPEVTTTIPETTTTLPEPECTGDPSTDPSGCPIDDCNLPGGKPAECDPPELIPPVVVELTPNYNG